MLSTQATRSNFRDFGTPAAGTWFGRGRTPDHRGRRVTVEVHGMGITIRDLAGAVVDSFGRTGKFWFIPEAAEAAARAAADEHAAQAAARNAERNAERDAAQLAELATRPVPAHATWVFDSVTGARVGYATQYGVVPLPAVEPTPAAPAPVVIVPCGGRKAPGLLPAGEKYVGSYHLQTRKAAAAIAARTGARVLVLSALYGLLELGDPVHDYNLRMGEPGSVTAGRVAEQAAALGITDAMVTVIAGKAYADVVTAVWPHAVRVLDGTNGMPHQMKRMSEIVRGEWSPAASAASAVPPLFGADLVAPPALELSRAADLRRGDVLAPGTFGVAGADPVLVIATPVAAGDEVALMVRPLTFPGRGKYVAVPADYGVDVTGHDELPASIATAPTEYPLPPVDQAERVALVARVDAGELEYVPAAELRAGDLVAPGGFGPWNRVDTITVTADPVYCDQVAGVARYDVATVVNLPRGPGPETRGALSAASFVPVVARGPVADELGGRVDIQRGDVLTVSLVSGVDVSLAWRAEEGDYRVTVIQHGSAQLVERPRHFDDEQLARQHARGMVISYRTTGEKITARLDTTRRVTPTGDSMTGVRACRANQSSTVAHDGDVSASPDSERHETEGPDMPITTATAITGPGADRAIFCGACKGWHICGAQVSACHNLPTRNREVIDLDGVTRWNTREQAQAAGVEYTRRADAAADAEHAPARAVRPAPGPDFTARYAEYTAAAMLDAIGDAIAHPDARFPADIDPNVLGCLEDAGMAFAGRPTNRGLARYTEERGTPTPTAPAPTPTPVTPAAAAQVAAPTVVMVAPARGVPGGPVAAELREDNPGESTVRVIYLHSRTSAWVARRRILAPDAAPADVTPPPAPAATVEDVQPTLFGDPEPTPAAPSTDLVRAAPCRTDVRSRAGRPDLHTDALPFTGGAGVVDPVDLGAYDVVLVNTSAGKDSMALLTALVELARAQGVDVRDKLLAVHCDLGRVEWAGTADLAAEHAATYGVPFVKVAKETDLLQQVRQRKLNLTAKAAKLTAQAATARAAGDLAGAAALEVDAAKKADAPAWPSSAARWCTSDQKTGQVEKLMTALAAAHREQLAAAGEQARPIRILNTLGIRAAESAARALKAPFGRDSASNTRREVTRWLPIFTWSDAQVWDTIRRSGLRVHGAYLIGMTRLSCGLCVLSSRADLVTAARANRALVDEYAAMEDEVAATFQARTSIRDIAAEADELGPLELPASAALAAA